jgi:transposase
MGMAELSSETGELRRVVESIRRGTFREADAERLLDAGRDATKFVLLTLAAAAVSPHAPSSTIPVYQKPSPQTQPKPRGARPGHEGKRRAKPARIDQRKTHRAPCCPDCGGRLKRTGDTRTRYTEDLPDDLKPVATEHTIHRDWCGKCQKRVEPRVPDALPKCQLGVRTLSYSAWLHYGAGVTLSQVRDVFASHLQMSLSEGGLCEMWKRLAVLLLAWYERLQQEALDSAVLHADETGWRVNGETHWLWCFTNHETTFYQIDRSRGSPALAKFFTEEFSGTLVSDFWAAYGAVESGDKQKCWAHLLRELDASTEPPSDDWERFGKRVRRLFKEALTLRVQREAMAEADYDLAVARLENRALRLEDEPWESADARRLAKRLARHGAELFTFLWHDGVDPTNNLAEREVRPAVMMRKNSYQNASPSGAQTQAVLMTVLRTLKRRGHNPLQALTNAVSHYAATGKMPPISGNVPSSE